ncbi:protein MIS12 homolog isoform X2 [Musa acuminata AAA Group]|uniref:protein MIS12 homolog isoform X2 n=1 Tax=Musa acuminata AAA Group TaxID=214697 RepID=UPI0031E166D3
MEGSESEAVFDAYNLNPQRFLNEVLNAVDDMVDGAFDFCLHQASQITGPGADRSEELARKEYSISVLQEVLSDQELDSHLDSLREKLAAAGMESQALHREINLLEMQSTADNKYNASVAEVQQLFKEHSVHLMFQELVESASKLHQKVAAELKSKRLGDMKQDGVCKKHCLSSGKQMVPDTGISSSLEDIQEIVSILKNT